MQVNKNDNKDKEKGINPVTAGAIGVVATAVAGTAAVVLSDKKRRKQIGKTLNNLGDKGREFVKNARTTLKQVDKRLKTVNKKLSKGAGREASLKAARA